MTLKEITLGLLACSILFGSGMYLGKNLKGPQPSEDDGQVMVIAYKGQSEAVGILKGKYNCPKGPRTIHLTPVQVFIGCAEHDKNDTLVTEESGTLIRIPTQAFRPFK